jgi:FAD/FMN-containing dehydrogenase
MKALEELFGERVSFEENERRLCTSDVGNLPDVVGIDVMDMLIERMPLAVVQPVSTEEVAALAKVATEHKIPLTPRAAASSGAGGAVPAKGGIAVDFLRMDQIVGIADDKKTVTVQAGVVWARLEEELNSKGLQVLAYPTSAPSSAVAGWIGSGGIGIGSFEYGSVAETIESLELVLPNGEVRRMAGSELDLVVDCQGITGMVTEVTLKIKPFEKVVPAGITFETLEDLQKGLDAVVKSVPIWTCNFETKDFVQLQHMAKGEGGEGKHTIIMGICP